MNAYFEIIIMLHLGAEYAFSNLAKPLNDQPLPPQISSPGRKNEALADLSSSIIFCTHIYVKWTFKMYGSYVLFRDKPHYNL